MPIREAGLKTRILKALNSRPGCYAVSFPGTALSRGQPDIIGCYLGHGVYLEVKSPKAPKETRLQAETLKKWRAAGGTAAVVRSVDEAEQVVFGLG